MPLHQSCIIMSADAEQPAPSMEDQGLSTEAPTQSSQGDSQKDKSPEAEGSSTRENRIQYRGANEAEQRMVEIVKAAMGYNKDKIWEWGNKQKVLKEILEPLNQLEIFKGSLKTSTLQTKWLDVQKKAESIIQGGEERFIRLAQNGGNEMSELDTLYLDLACKIDKNTKHREAEKRDKEEADTDAKERERACHHDHHGQAMRL